ncbi:transcription repressor OFP7-like [Solanum dulcamara]|uniref:transcription repressor OFP7-like n=1 Tax=Solanum dulcamara TaxID=45834 RepID=UPI002486BF3C|nr:transcription repressor OFP7-like [Solanum dulcamara]
MAKLLKLRISKAVSSSFHSCRSKDPCTLPQHPIPSFFPNTQLITLDLLSEKMIHRNNESLLISTPITAGNRCSSRNGEANTSDDSRTSYVLFSDDSSLTTTTRRPKKIATTKRRVKNVTRGIINKNGRRSSISTSTTSSDGELPARLSELIPCNVERKVKESFAIVKKSEDPYEDFKSSMMEMILEKKMFEKNDLEQLLQCFLSLNAKNYHGVIVEAFSEIWNTLFSPNHS